MDSRNSFRVAKFSLPKRVQLSNDWIEQIQENKMHISLKKNGPFFQVGQFIWRGGKDTTEIIIQNAV
jgi:hypothetical protein